jgi:predicted RNase H-like nuclease
MRKELAKDDILDAISLAITASSQSETLMTIPEEPRKDENKLPMEIVFTNRNLIKSMQGAGRSVGGFS